MLEAGIIYLSLIFGILLYAVAKEEVKQWKKYILTTRKILIILVAAVLIYPGFKFTSVLFLFLGFTIFIFLKKTYLLVGSTAFLGLLSQNPIMPLSILSLLSITQSSLSAQNKKTFLINSAYFILPFSLVLIETFIKGNLNIFTGLVAGGLLAQLKGP